MGISNPSKRWLCKDSFPRNEIHVKMDTINGIAPANVEQDLIEPVISRLLFFYRMFHDIPVFINLLFSTGDANIHHHQRQMLRCDAEIGSQF